MDGMSGSVRVLVIRRLGFYERGLPSSTPLRYRLRSLWYEATLRARLFLVGAWRGLRGTGVIGVGRLYASIQRCRCGAPDSHSDRGYTVCPDAEVDHRGLVSTKVITNAGVTFLRDDWNSGANDFSLMNFHGCGTTNTAENVTDTALAAESTTALNPDNTRATGTRSVPASNQFQSVGTLTFDAAASVVEHGLFSTSGTGTGTLWDRSVFSVLTMASGDSIQFTYVGTLSSGG